MTVEVNSNTGRELRPLPEVVAGPKALAAAAAGEDRNNTRLSKDAGKDLPVQPPPKDDTTRPHKEDAIAENQIEIELDPKK